MEIIVEVFKETILTFSWGEVASTIVITALCFCLVEVIARIKYKKYLKEQGKEAVGSHFYYKIVGQDVLVDKTLSDYRNEVFGYLSAIFVLLFYIFIVFLLFEIALILVSS